MYCVYLHKNKINGKIYVGVTNDTSRRWRQNGTEYRNSISFYKAIRKYGFDAFEHVVLENNLTKEQAFEREKYYITYYRSNDKNKGYNVSPGGNGGKVYINHPRNMLGKRQTDYQKEHQSKLMMDKSFNPMKNGVCKWGITHEHPKGMIGKHHSTEHKKRVSETMISHNINCKPVKVYFPDGSVRMFRSTDEAQQIGLTKPVILRIIRSCKPYEIKTINQYTERIKHLSGIRIEYLDNTEITGSTKKDSVL